MRRRRCLVSLLVSVAAVLLVSCACAGQEAPSGAPEITSPSAAAPVTPSPTLTTPTTPTAPELQVPPTVTPVIIAIEVTGNERISTADILAVVVSAVGGFYSDQQVARDVDAIRALGWFSRVSSEREVTEAGIRLIFGVVENPVITDVQFEGVTVFTPEELRALMKAAPGTVFNSSIVRQDLDAIQEFYESRGYSLALILSPRMTPEGVLVIPVLEGEIEAVKISGNTRTKEYVVRRYISTQPGDIYNTARIRADVNALNGSALFESARVAPGAGTQPGKVVVVFEIVEKQRTGQATVGFGYSSVQGLVGFVDLTKSNLGGTAQSVTVRGEFGGRDSYELYYAHPWVAPRTAMNVGLYNRLIVREAFVTDDQGEQRSIFYDERRTGGSISFGRPLSFRTKVYAGFRSDQVSVTDVSEEEQNLLTGIILEERDVRSITAGVVSDVRDFQPNPRSGAYHALSTEFAGLLGGVEFNKFIGDERRYYPVGRATVALRLLAGTVTGDPPYLEQFLLGGAESLRGFRNDRFVGTNMIVLNTEYRLPFGQNLTGVAFVDVGDAWGGPTVEETPIQGDLDFTAHVGYGVGIRVKTPLGPLRLDIGFSTDGTETHFGLGHVF